MTLSYLGYLAFTAVLVATPGATTAVVVRNTLAGGRRAGLAAALGAALANSTHAAAAGLGLAVLVTRWPEGLAAIRVVGALYLAWLGARSLARAIVNGRSDLMVSGDSDAASRSVSHRPSFREGLAVNLLNPAIITFYLVAVPTFMPAGAARGYYLLLASSHVLMAFGVHAAWAAGFDRLRETFAPPTARRWLEGATGAALVALAVVIFVWR